MPDEFNDELEDDDILADLIMPDDDNTDEDGKSFDPKEINALKEQISQLEKEKNGLLQTVKSDRRKRQEYKGQLDAVTATVDRILAEREQAAANPDKQSSENDDIIPVDVTEDGDAFIPRGKLDALIKPYEEKINQLETYIKQATQQQTATQSANELIQSLVGSDERYGPAYSRYKAARKWVNDKVIDYQRENNINRKFTSGDAMSKVFRDQNIQKEFEQEFPGLDLASVTMAEDSEWHFEEMLKKTADGLEALKQPDDRFRRVVSKPSALGKSTNAKAGELSLSERVSKLSSLDFTELTDEQVEALTKHLGDEEQKGGITF